MEEEYTAAFLQELHEDAEIALDELYERYRVPQAVRDLADFTGVLYAATVARTKGCSQPIDDTVLDEVIPAIRAIVQKEKVGFAREGRCG